MLPRVANKLGTISTLDDRPNDTSGLTAAELKAKFDADSEALKTYLNDTLLPYLESAAAAGQLGITTIPGYSAATVQAMLEQIVTAMQEITQGSVADKSITLAKLAAEVTAVALGGAAASHNHAASAITSGTMAAARIPVLDSTKLGAGSVGTAQLGSAVVTSEKLTALAVLSRHIAAGAVTTPKIANGAITNALIAAGSIERGSLAASALGNASGDLSATPFAVENNGRLLIFASDSDVSYALTQTLWSSLPQGFSVTILKANSAASGKLTINWENMAGVYDLTQGTVKYNNTGSLELVRRGDMVTFEKWGSTTRLMISGNLNTPNFYKGTSATPPSTWQPGDIYLQYQ